MFWKSLFTIVITLTMYSHISGYVISDDGTTVHGVNKYGNHYWLNRNTGTIQYRNTPGGYHYNNFGENHTYQIPDYNNSGSVDNNYQTLDYSNTDRNLNNNFKAPDYNNTNRNLNNNFQTPYNYNDQSTNRYNGQRAVPEKEKSVILLIIMEVVACWILAKILESLNLDGCFWYIVVVIAVYALWTGI